MTKVYCFGNTQNGELGLGGIEDEHILLPRKQKPWIDSKCYKLRQLASGRNHTLLLLVNDTKDRSVVLSCGSNERNQLARSGSWKRLEPIDCLEAHVVTRMACGANHSLVLTEAGQVFSWGCNIFGQLGIGNKTDESLGKPSLVKKLAAEHVTQIACGGNHNLALTKCGVLYSWGSNAFGQLGIGTYGNCENSPIEVATLRSVPIRLLSAGGSHTAILSHTQAIYVWGKNQFGQLGVNDTKNRVIPTVQQSLRWQKICYLSLGEEHSAALTEGGGLYTWGAGMYGQLGHNKNSNEILPRRVFELMGNCVTQVSCGRCHTLAAVGQHGKLHAFGLNGSGQLGIGTQVSKFAPIHVSGQWSEIGVKELALRNITGHLVPFVSDTASHSSKEASPVKTASPSSQDSLKSSDSEMSIEELSEYDTVMTATEDETFVIEEPDEDSRASGDVLVREPSFVCTPNEIIPTKEESVEIDEYLSDPDSESLGIGTQHYILVEIVASKGDQSFVLTTRLAPRTKARDFRDINPREQILSFDNAIFDQLVNVAEDKDISLELEYIENVFRSISCWNASYIDTSNKSVTTLPLIDWSAASYGFHRIEDIENFRLNELIYQSILSLIHKLPNIYDEHNLDAELLRIYLLLPKYHMFRTGIQTPDVMNKLIIGFTRAVLNLSDYAREVLSNWWSNLEDRHFKSLIKNCKKCVQELLDTQDKDNQNLLPQQQQPIKIDSLLHDNLRVSLSYLELLHRANQKHNKISFKEFYIDGISDKFDVKLDYIYWLSAKRQQPKNQPRNTLFLCDYPFIFDPSAKTLILATDSAIQQQNAAEASIYRSLVSPIPFMVGNQSGVIVANPYLVISVNRNTILQETINQLCFQNQNPYEFKKPLKVNFEGEEAIDAGQGMKKEFFLLLMKEMLDPQYGMFHEYEETHSIWFNPGDVGEDEDLVMYHLIGIVCGLAIYNHVLIYLPFPLALYKKILDEKLDIDDLNSLDPILVRNLKEILNPNCKEQEFNSLYGDMNFVITLKSYGSNVEYELENGGRDKALNWNNRSEYVELYWKHILNVSVKRQFEAFKKGFTKVLDVGILHLFHSEELMQLLTGQDNYDWSFMEKSATDYKPPFSATHPTIVKFWKVFHTLTVEQKKKFLLFLTGSDRIPILGMKALKITIQPMKVSGDHLPVAHTCFNVLDLPEEYSSEHQLKEKLLQALEYTHGFALA